MMDRICMGDPGPERACPEQVFRIYIRSKRFLSPCLVRGIETGGPLADILNGRGIIHE